MSRKIRIASALTLASVLSISAPTVAFAGGPLLSGYGGPGAGEQAIIGSTLLGGPHGGAGSGGSTGSRGSTDTSGEGSAGGSSSDSSATNAAGGSSSSGRAAVGTRGQGRGPTSSKAVAHQRRTSQTAQSSNGAAKRVGTYVYPSSSGTVPSNSSVIGISGGDVLLLVGIVTTLALVGVLTVRLARLQP